MSYNGFLRILGTDYYDNGGIPCMFWRLSKFNSRYNGSIMEEAILYPLIIKTVEAIAVVLFQCKFMIFVRIDLICLVVFSIVLCQSICKVYCILLVALKVSVVLMIICQQIYVMNPLKSGTTKSIGMVLFFLEVLSFIRLSVV